MWCDLGGKWACPGYDQNKYASFQEAYKKGDTYGHSILNDYYMKVLLQEKSFTQNNRVKQLEVENWLLKMEINRLKSKLK